MSNAQNVRRYTSWTSVTEIDLKCVMINKILTNMTDEVRRDMVRGK